MKNIKLILITAAFLSCVSLNAQTIHELSFSVGGGLSALNYDSNVGSQKMNLGGQVGVGYQFLFSDMWGIRSGAEIALYNSAFTLDNFSTRYMTVDMTDKNFEFRSTVNNYEETHSLIMLQIPLMVQFQYGDSEERQFYVAAGGKVGLGLSGKYKSTSASVVNSGYYTFEDYEYTTQEFLGFGTFANRRAEGNLNLKMAFFASIEIGMKWRLSEDWLLYTGAYLDYGLSDIRKAEAQNTASPHFVDYNTASPRNFTVNSVVNSQYTQNGATQSFINKMTPMTAGIKLRIAMEKW